MIGLLIVGLVLSAAGGVGYLFAKYKTVAAVEAELKALEAEGVADVKSVVARVKAAL